MANTYTLISSNVLTSSAASVTFSSIPATYTDLVLRISARTDFADWYENTLVTFNGTSSGYSSTFLRAFGSTVGNGRTSSTTTLNPAYTTSATATSNTFSSAEYYIPSYTVSQNKPISITNAAENNSTTQAANNATAGLWSNTAAITSIKLENAFGPGNFVSGSSFYLYGIKNS
jgi:hypothetical protein